MNELQILLSVIDTVNNDNKLQIKLKVSEFINTCNMVINSKEKKLRELKPQIIEQKKRITTGKGLVTVNGNEQAVCTLMPYEINKSYDKFYELREQYITALDDIEYISSEVKQVLNKLAEHNLYLCTL